MIDDYLVSLILNILQLSTLPTLAPLKLKFFIGGNDVTLSYFDVAEIVVTNWTRTTNTVLLENSTEIVFGTALQTYFGAATIQIIDQQNNIVSENLYNTAIETGTEYRIPVGFLRISITGANLNLGNFLLDLISLTNINSNVKSPTYTTPNDPLFWELVLSSTVLKNLNKSFFSKIKTNIIGQKEISYGETFSLNNNIFYNVNSLTVRKKNSAYNTSYDYNITSRTWFDLLGVSNLLFYPRQPIDVFNNSLNWVYNPSVLDVDTVVLNESSTSLISIDFDGNTNDTSFSTTKVSDNIVYNPQFKIFNAESGYFGSVELLEYSVDVAFPDTFTLQYFFRFNGTPVGRNCLFFRKNGVIRVEKINNNLTVTVNANTFNIPFTFNNTTDYHLFITKTNTTLNVRINSTLNSTQTLTSATMVQNSNNLIFNDSTLFLDCYVSGFYLDDVVLPFEEMIEPTPKYQYFWDETPTYAWTSKHFKFTHWLKLTEAKT